MKHPIAIVFLLIASAFAGTNGMKANEAEDKKQTFHITVLSTAGNPQTGMIMKILGYSTEYVSDEEGLFEFEHEIREKNIRTANFYFPDNKQKSVKSLRLDEAARDTILRIDSREDLIRYKQSGKTFPVTGIVKNGGKPIAHAEVAIQGTGRRTFTDSEGKFTIEADYNHTVTVRAAGMENRYLDASLFLAVPDKPYTVSMTRKGADRIYASVEQMPQYPGGMKAFFNYIRRKVRPEELAVQTQTEGTVMIQFVVEKDGSITSPHIVRSLHTELDTVALNAVTVMRDWIPAKDHGTVVRCKYSVPVTFRLPEPEEPEKKPEGNSILPKDSLRTDSLLTDSISVLTDSLAIAISDSLRTDSLQQILPPATDSLRIDSLSVQKPDSMQTDSTTRVTEVSPAKPKKRSAFVEFFRRLFGIKDKEEKARTTEPEQKPAEQKDIPPTETEE